MIDSAADVTAAKCPEWMKRFDWGAYGMGGLENFHGWMQKAGAVKQPIAEHPFML